MDKTVLYGLSYGMYVVGADDGGRPVGCIVNTCVQITSDNPIIAVSLNKNNHTFDVIKRTGRFVLSVITEGTDPNIISVFGFQSSRDRDKYAQFGYKTLHGLPLVNGCFAGRLICEVIDTTDCETHEVVFARLTDTVKEDECPPMTYDYYHNVVKGKAPKNAPTYRSEEDAPKQEAVSGIQQYVCSVCGYVHDGDIADEPEDYRCPVCGMPKCVFEPKE